MDAIIKCVGDLNWQTIIAMFAIGWYFTKDIRNELIKLDLDLRQQGHRMDERFQKMDQKFDERFQKTDQKFYDLLKESKEGKK